VLEATLCDPLMSMSLQTKTIYEFGSFRLDVRQHLLTHKGEAVPLAPKAFETLLVLVENSGQVLSKEQLMERIWPETFVEEGNLALNISVLRKALGKSPDRQPYIETFPRRGYRFITSVQLLEDEAADLIIQEHSKSRIILEHETQESAPQLDSAHSDSDGSATLGALSRNPRLHQRLLVPAGGAAVALSVILLAVNAFNWREKLLGHASLEPSIAVLPFTNLSPEQEQEYFSDSLTDELINALSKLQGWRVVARTSAFKFKGTAEDVRQLGTQLGVRLILEGCVRKAGNRLRVTAQLVSVSNGCQVWSGAYEQEVKGAFANQQEIAQVIVHTVQMKLMDNNETD
jgi:TolB-like protein/DNA-binding winged helix-turn-helix (wHTH) protein